MASKPRNKQNPTSQHLSPKSDTGKGHVIQAQHFSGPLPPPDTLADYDSIIPGAADRILAMAEEQAQHRQAQEQKALHTDIWIAKAQVIEMFIGQVFGLIIGLSFLGVGAWLTVQGHPWAGTGLGTAGIVGLVSAFIYGRSRRPDENGKK